ncbi:MAG: methylated-DNA--[protein]-cysteine S-methyltransferase [bacterium]
MYVFKFKTKIAVLEINASKAFINEIKIEKTGEKHYKNNNGKRLNSRDKALLLSSNDCCRLPHIYRLIDLLDNYFSNKIADFSDIPVNFSYYSDFSEKILKALRGVKYGETLSYKELAINAGYGEKYSRACAMALSANKTPIIIPCHRIIHSNGKPGGYSGGGGVHFKTALLSLERDKHLYPI